MTDVLIAPSILAADFTRLGEQVQAAEAAGADRIHIDVMDGRFVPNITMGPLVVDAVRRATSLPLDVHLMIVEPDQHIQAFAEAGATTITVHYEACVDLYRTLSMIRHAGCRPGIAINPHTRAAVLYDVLPVIDLVLVMTVSPGFGGQQLIEETLPKMARLRAMANEKLNKSFDIGADGGISTDTIASVVQAGGNVLVAGSAIFNPNHPVQDGINSLRQAILDAENA